jgi:dTDP-4-dehydrorhamnose 3,5-epimerase
MKVHRLEIPEVLLLEPKVFGDARGFFFEAYNRRTFREATGLDVDFVQDNQSQSVRNVLRGLHYQVRQPQGKLVSVSAGEIFDVAVDLRNSPTLIFSWFPTRRWCITRPPTTTPPSTSARSSGTTRSSPSPGRWKESRS